MRLLRERHYMAAAALGGAYLWVCREACRGEHQHGFMNTIARQEDPLFYLTGPPVSREDRQRRASEDPMIGFLGLPMSPEVSRQYGFDA